jgi:dTMP kinase
VTDRGPTSAGHFITFEGIEGSGKTTQLERLAERLRQAALDVVVTREPGGTVLGRELRALVLRPAAEPMSPVAELLLYATDRAQHLTEIVEPALERGAIVLCDRYKDATLAYQGYGRELDLERIHELHRRPPLDRSPDRTVLLVLDPAVALARATRRNVEHDLAETAGRFENERLEFHRRVAAGYSELATAEAERFRVVDAQGSVEEVGRRVLEAVRDLLPLLEGQEC